MQVPSVPLFNVSNFQPKMLPRATTLGTPEKWSNGWVAATKAGKQLISYGVYTPTVRSRTTKSKPPFDPFEPHKKGLGSNFS